MAKQKRSENTYTKINTVFYRDENNIIMPYDSLVMPELEWLRNCKFDCEEKVDGTNIRLEVSRTDILSDLDNVIGIRWDVAYKGKTDNANVPKMLMEYLQTNYPEDKVLTALGLRKEMMRDDTDMLEKCWSGLNEQYKTFNDVNLDKIPNRYTIYGEGYGVKIQSCGGNYLKDSNSFIGFDVKVDDMYLLRENRDDVFNKLGCPIVPFVGQFTIDEAIEYVKKGFKSNISENTEFLAEGLVCRIPSGMLTRRGDRIIFKVKTCDWNKYFAKYGTYDKVEQVKNSHI